MANQEDPTADWSPEKERGADPGAIMRRAEELFKKLHASADAARAMPIRAIRPAAYAIAAPFQSPSQITVRRILNGFIMTYFEAKPEPFAAPPTASPEIAKKLFSPHQVEAFIADPLDGSVYLKKALEAAELLAQSAKILEELQAAAVSPDEETRRLERPPELEA